jgi:hypothetical protein
VKRVIWQVQERQNAKNEAKIENERARKKEKQKRKEVSTR